MRVNVYAEEMTNRVEIITKEVEGHEFTGVRFYLELPVTGAEGAQYRGPFMHGPGDDDSAAVTFWGKQHLGHVLGTALKLLNEHYAKRESRDGCSIAQEVDPTIQLLEYLIRVAQGMENAEVWRALFAELLRSKLNAAR